MKGCNNYWQDTWLITPAAEVTLTGRYLALSMDGTFGAVNEPSPGSVSRFQSRASIMPLLRLPLYRSIFIGAGYGLTHVFRREDVISAAGTAEILNNHEFSGELRAEAGFGISFGGRLSLLVKGGYSRISDTQYTYYVSTGLLFKPGGLPVRETVAATAVPVELPVQSPELVPLKEDSKSTARLIVQKEKKEDKAHIKETPERTLLFTRATVIHTSDIIISEFNLFIESLLSERGVSIFDWNALDAVLREEDTYAGDTAAISRVGRERFGIQAIVETALRYAYTDSYGGGIRVEHASVRILDTAGSRVIGVLNFDSGEAGLDVCKRYFKDHIDDIIYGTPAS
ncbi:hypothetical protein JXO52_12905 [bacterium]|nr:hypothetical protein [bacterium]